MKPLKKLLARSWQRQLSRADALHEKGDLDRALTSYRAALRAHEGEADQRWDIEERVETVRVELHRRHLAAARRFAELGDQAAVADALFAASEHAYTASEKKAVEEARKELSRDGV